MLSSYLEYISECESLGRPMPEFHLKLWDIVHREEITVFHRSCQRSPCRRCDEGVGGFQFKWYSAVWARTYNRLRREGSWKAPELTAQQRQSHIPGY